MRTWTLIPVIICGWMSHGCLCRDPSIYETGHGGNGKDCIAGGSKLAHQPSELWCVSSKYNSIIFSQLRKLQGTQGREPAVTRERAPEQSGKMMLLFLPNEFSGRCERVVERFVCLEESAFWYITAQGEYVWHKRLCCEEISGLN